MWQGQALAFPRGQVLLPRDHRLVGVPEVAEHAPAAGSDKPPEFSEFERVLKWG